MTVADILKAEPRSTSVFQKFELDYSACADYPFEEACSRNSVDPQVVKKELINLRLSLKQTHESFGQLLERVIRQHDNIKNAILPVRQALLLAVEHHTSHPYELLTVKTKFEILIESLEVHLYKEERILFPEFINLWKEHQFRMGYPLPFRMMYPIKTLESEHESVKTILREIRELIRYSRIPGNTDKYYRTVCIELETFEKKLVELIDMEDRMLFPETLALEKIFTRD